MSFKRLARMAVGTSIVACCAVIPAAASAAVQVSAGADGGDYLVAATGDGGSQNLDVTATPTAISFAGNGETMTAGTGCTGTGPVTCTIPGGDWSVVFTEVTLGGGVDQFDASALNQDAGLFVDAGDGADDIVGSDLPDYLVAGSGVDTVSSLGGDDIIDVKDGAVDGPLDCGAGTDLVIWDLNETLGGVSGCERGSPVLSGAATILGDPRVGSPVEVGGYSTYQYFSFSGFLTVDWYTCATLSGQGCGPRTVLDARLAYRPSAAELGRYLFANVATGLNAYSYLGALDSRQTAPVQVLPALSQTLPNTGFTVGSFKSGTTGSLTVNVPGPGRLTAAPTAAAKKLVATTKKTTTTAGAVKLPIKLTSAGKKKLKSKGKLKVKVKVSFTPTTGATTSKTVSVTFKKKK